MVHTATNSNFQRRACLFLASEGFRMHVAHINSPKYTSNKIILKKKISFYKNRSRGTNFKFQLSGGRYMSLV